METSVKEDVVFILSVDIERRRSFGVCIGANSFVEVGDSNVTNKAAGYNSSISSIKAAVGGNKDAAEEPIGSRINYNGNDDHKYGHASEWETGPIYSKPRPQSSKDYKITRRKNL